MCGFIVWYNTKRLVNPTRLRDALRTIQHRGPDSQNLCFIDSIHSKTSTIHCSDANRDMPQQPQNIGFAHCRLSIIDLTTAANQPFISKDSNYILAYNGEIFNYVEERLKYNLSYRKNKSRGDTEVLFSGLIEKGLDALITFNGIWAFVFYNRVANKLFLSRDRYGQKPLFYYTDEHNFIACSEIKCIYSILAIKRKLNRRFLDAFLLSKIWLNFDTGETPYEDIRSLQPGSNLIYDLTKNTYRISKDNDIKKWMPQESSLETLSDDLEDAVTERLRSDVPLGIQVSGGVDSTIIASIASKHISRKNIVLFTIKNKKDDNTYNDDLLYSRLLSKQLKIELVEIELSNSEEKFHQDIKMLTKHYEYPINPFLLSYSSFLLNQQISKQGIKVVLDGTGGDEILGGYPNSFATVAKNLAHRKFFLKALQYWSLYQEFAYGSKKEKAFSFFNLISFALNGNKKNLMFEHKIFDILRNYFQKNNDIDICKELLSRYFVRNKAKDVKDIQLYEIENFLLPYALYVNDQNAMINSLENRSPLCDFRLAKYISLPADYKMKNGYNKYFLRKHIPDFISDKIRWRKGKEGMGFPPNIYVQNLQDTIDSSISHSPLVQSMVKIDTIKRDREKYKHSTTYNSIIRNLYSLALLDQVYSCAL